MRWLPNGFDIADGVTPIPPFPMGSGGTPQTVGTKNPEGAVQFDTPLTRANPDELDPIQTEEDVNSPEIERAEQATFQHSFKTSWAKAIDFLSVLGRGTFLQDRNGNITRVLSSRVKRAGVKAELSVVAESISFDSPPDDFQCVPVSLGIDIVKHPRYFYALNIYPNDYTDIVGVAPNTATRADIKQKILLAIQTYRDTSPVLPNAGTISSVVGLAQKTVIDSLTGKVIVTGAAVQGVDVSGDPQSMLAVAAAQEIIQKIWRLEETPYISGFQITWSQYYFRPVDINPGGYIEDPLGIVPDYFLAPTQNNQTNIFEQFAAINPQCFSSDGTPSGAVNISWLRQADEIEYQRTWFKVTRTWIGSPVGHWDEQLYGNINRPSQPSDYLPLSPV